MMSIVPKSGCSRIEHAGDARPPRRTGRRCAASRPAGRASARGRPPRTGSRRASRSPTAGSRSVRTRSTAARRRPSTPATSVRSSSGPDDGHRDVGQALQLAVVEPPAEDERRRCRAQAHANCRTNSVKADPVDSAEMTLDADRLMTRPITSSAPAVEHDADVGAVALGALARPDRRRAIDSGRVLTGTPPAVHASRNARPRSA